jgi:hypothetical protein
MNTTTTTNYTTTTQMTTHGGSHPHEGGNVGSHRNGTGGTSTNCGGRRLVHNLRKGRGLFLARTSVGHGRIVGWICVGWLDGWMVWWMDGIGTVFESHKRRRRSSYRVPYYCSFGIFIFF